MASATTTAEPAVGTATVVSAPAPTTARAPVPTVAAVPTVGVGQGEGSHGSSDGS